MKGEPLIVREGLRPLQEPPCATVPAPDLLLLPVAQREDSQGEHFVDLCPIEKIEGALGRHFRVVRQDDRRSKEEVAVRERSGEDWPEPGRRPTTAWPTALSSVRAEASSPTLFRYSLKLSSTSSWLPIVTIAYKSPSSTRGSRDRRVGSRSPTTVSAEMEGNTQIILSCHDNVLLGQVAAKIRAYRPPEPYQGKGVLYENERIRRKAGKAGKK